MISLSLLMHLILILNPVSLRFLNASPNSISDILTIILCYLSVSFKLKILGATLDPSLNFIHFASQIIQASNFHLHAIKQVRKFLPFNTAVALTNSSFFQRSSIVTLFFWTSELSHLKVTTFPKSHCQYFPFLHLILALIAFISCRSH